MIVLQRAEDFDGFIFQLVFVAHIIAVTEHLGREIVVVGETEAMCIQVTCHNSHRLPFIELKFPSHKTILSLS